MLLVRLACVGRLKEEYWRQAVAEYEKRLRPFCRFEILEIGESRLPDSPTEGDIRRALEREGEQLLQKSVGLLCPLCIEGRLLDSPGMAALLGQAMQSPGAVTFFIGSSFGLSQQVKQSGKGFSMSPMTFPHQLARVMLCEQLYRGFQIQAGTKYHK
ncbi:23S rRNA (pseudouridine(1915)-N(3))-methyltransferase RlmH [Acutalibacter sp. JLR.KK004]|uniref:23S rRNA (pseudouridine(1915)-N(3))-methyltransferase RlmH n=1 Tax=Acutalibacter sp. JLR.KK004 TaxID=3112622 RepID=UPI00216FAB35|nr:23S rRNA (pseudouridine(1915)-N(3))-methyltransferase RlmH [Acutalibacter sp.]